MHYQRPLPVRIANCDGSHRWRYRCNLSLPSSLGCLDQLCRSGHSFSRMATQTYLGFEPTNGYASPSTAKALAQTAHCRAVSFSKAPQQALGIALTATLPTKPPGSDARLTQNCCIHVASQGKDLARGWSLCFAAKPSEREVSESVAEQMFLIALQDSLHQHGFPIRSELVQPLNDGGFTVTMTHADDR